MSRAETTLDDWLDVDQTDDETQESVSASQWEPQEPECECGAPVSEWHSSANARRMVRIYGSQKNSTVPACPACVDWGFGNNRQNVESVPHAIKEMDTESSVRRQTRSALALKEVTRDD